MSVREDIQNRILTYVHERGVFSAPYGILDGKHTNAKGRSYRSVTFGKARTLDATVNIYGPKYLQFQFSGSLYDHGAHRDSIIFTSVEDLIAFLDKNT